MSGYGEFPGRTIDQFRRQTREETFRRFEEQKRLKAEQLERERLEAEAARVPLHEEMRGKVERLESRLSDLQAGDPRAVAVIRQILLETLGIVAYILEGDNEQETL